MTVRATRWQWVSRAALAKDGAEAVGSLAELVQELEEAVAADVLSTALYARFRSRQEHTFGEKVLSAMRFGFGGHVEGSEPTDPKPKPKAPREQPITRHAAR